MDTQKFNIVIDGIEKEANVIKVITIDGREYVIYTVDNGDGTSDIFSSEIVKDENGFDKLVDIDDTSVKSNISEIVNIIFS